MIIQDLLNTPKIIRYGIVFIAIFILLKAIPNNSMSNRDILVSSIVLFALYVIAENVFTKASICDNKEKFETTSEEEQELVAPTPTPQIIMPPVEQTSSLFVSSSSPPSSNISSHSMISVNQSNNDMKPGECVDCVNKTTDEFGMDSYIYKVNRKYESGITRADAGVMKSEVQYTDYNILPVTPEDSRLYEYGYSYLPPEKWYPTPQHPPICVTEKRSVITPILTTGSPVDMKEWDSSRRITPGDVINIDYARDKLNSGR